MYGLLVTVIVFMTFVGQENNLIYDIFGSSLFSSTIPLKIYATKTIKPHICSAVNPAALPRRRKVTRTTFPTIAGNDSTAFQASLLRGFGSLFNKFFKVPLSFGEDDPEAAEPPPPPKTSVIANTIVEMVMERAVSIDSIVIHYSRNNVLILSPKD